MRSLIEIRLQERARHTREVYAFWIFLVNFSFVTSAVEPLNRFLRMILEQRGLAHGSAFEGYVSIELRLEDQVSKNPYYVRRCLCSSRIIYQVHRNDF